MAKQQKVLYFEGAGNSPCGEMENCRIRTALHLDSGQPVYLEIIGSEAHKWTREQYPGWDYVGRVDFCYHIAGGEDDVNEHCIPGAKNTILSYTKGGISDYVNSLGCSFDAIQVLHDLDGYRVHREHGGYVFGDEFQPIPSNTRRAMEIQRHFNLLDGERGRLNSLWVDETDRGLLHILRRLPEGAQFWRARCDTDDWQETLSEWVEEKMQVILIRDEDYTEDQLRTIKIGGASRKRLYKIILNQITRSHGYDRWIAAEDENIQENEKLGVLVTFVKLVPANSIIREAL